MIYLLLGPDSFSKDPQIAEIKKTHLSSADALPFDYEVLDGNQLDTEDLQKALLAFPVVSSQRVILIRAAERLNVRQQELLLEFARKRQEQTILILDSAELEKGKNFISQLAVYAKVFRYAKEAEANVFDMTRMMTAGQPAEVLKSLFDLLSKGDHPLQILGGLVWFWGKSKNRLSPQKFRRGLLLLKETDLNIKRTRLKPEYALEVLVVELMILLSSRGNLTSACPVPGRCR